MKPFEYVLVARQVFERSGRFGARSDPPNVPMIAERGWERLLFSYKNRLVVEDYACLSLDVVNDVTHVFREKRPRVQQKDFVGHNDDYAVVTLKATRIVVIFEEEVLT